MRFTESQMSGGPGIMILQDPNYQARGIAKDRVDRRSCILGVRIKNVQITGQGIGHYEYDQSGDYQIADMVGSLFWPADSRPTQGVSFAWPAMMGQASKQSGPGSTTVTPGGGGAYAKPKAGAVFTDPPSGPDANAATFGAKPSGNTPAGNPYGAGSGGSGFVFADPAAQPDANSKTYGFSPVNAPVYAGFEPTDTGAVQQNGPGGAGGAGGGANGADPGNRPGVATEGGKNSCGTMPDSLAKMLPIATDWVADTRYKSIKANMPDIWPKFPKGTFGIALPASDETKQQELFFPIFPNLMAIQKSGDPMMGSLVCDANSDFEIDKSRVARLQSMMWVLKKPGGGTNAIAWNLGESGCGDSVGGYVIDKPSAGTPASPKPVATGGSGGPGQTLVDPAPMGGGMNGPAGGAGGKADQARVIGLISALKGGPIDVGDGACDHVTGSDADGNPICACHISTKSLFRKNNNEDGEILFEDFYPSPKSQPSTSPAHIGWDQGSKKWKLWAEVPLEIVTTTDWQIPHHPPWDYWFPYKVDLTIREPVITSVIRQNLITTSVKTDVATGPTGGYTGAPPPGATPFGGTLPGTDTPDHSSVPTGGYHPLTPLGDTVQPTSNLSSGSMAATTMALGSAGLNAVAQDYTSGKADATSPANANTNLASTPVSGAMSAVSAQGGTVSQGYGYSDTNTPGSGDPRVFTTKPGASKYPGGTTSGGWVIHPPETSPADIKKWGMVPPGIQMSKTYMMVAPGAYFGAGIPLLANGGVRDGFVWTGDSASGGDLVFSSVYGGATPVEVFRMIALTGNFSWKSGQGSSGEFDHANTSNRVYTFPDVTAPVAIMTTGTSSPAGVTTQPESSMFWDKTADKLYVNRDGSTGWSAVGPQITSLSSDANIATNTTLANVSGLVLAIPANETWVYTVDLDIGALLSTTGAKFAITVPAGATVSVQASLVGSVPATAKTYGLTTTTGGAALDFTAANLASQTDARVSIMVYVLNGGTAGNVQVQAAQSSSSGTNLTLRRGSRIVGAKQ